MCLRLAGCGLGFDWLRLVVLGFCPAGGDQLCPHLDTIYIQSERVRVTMVHLHAANLYRRRSRGPRRETDRLALLSENMLARRFACPPVNEACFELRQIPNARPDMDGTVLLEATREYLQSLLGEMVQMVNEAVRRRAKTARDASKPLSLEYMADRLDVDDPLTGYLAFTKNEGWLQGFITCTTFVCSA